ncbi:30S ribosome-binding factor RbfA [Leptospira sp. 85282-16]|uniref:Ribosome-binding factor A n=1 Tax=Leptospira montravelensis TaxID=2484961 RepID=A0ABY2LUN4_9LEPT|nr:MULTISPECIES: 30S ribosome-binding factor RbfA [Leptospira]MCT8332717.1 30S ribosome-binding factor RbfA [Leptospira sp. 85282-16]TGK83920.1 30S ribosome-binding factor RbfA [Leptospira montravelensis]TGL05927.1 30S ribosome-binding factor RbfA [Leptospira montravelensis]
MNPIRMKKLESEIIRLISTAILEGKVKDPRVFLPSFHRIEISEDLKYAKVYFTALCNNNERKKLTQGLVSCAGFLSSLVGKNLHLHTNPKFSFVWDNNYIKSLEVNRLIDESAPKTLFEELHPDQSESNTDSEDDSETDISSPSQTKTDGDGINQE